MNSILFLGTGAADWDYYPKGELRYDTEKKLRRTSSVLLNGRVLIDPAPSAFDYAEYLGCDLREITDIFITHTHDDHYQKEVLLHYVKASRHRLKLWARETALPNLGLSEEEQKLFDIHALTPLHEVETAGMKVMPLPANHQVDEREFGLHYVFASEGKRIFYGCDGAWLLGPAWDYLMTIRLDAVIFDTTVGDYNGDYRVASHNSIPMVRMLLEAFRKNDVLRPDGKVILSHFARTLHEDIGTTEAKMAAEGMIAAYDSMKIEL